MAIFIKVSDPSSFLKDIKASIDGGSIKEWTYDDDGDITSTDEKLKNEAWFHPYMPVGNILVLGIIGRKNVMMSKSMYSMYHSEFIKTLLLNYGSQLDDISIMPPFLNHFDTQSIEEK